MTVALRVAAIAIGACLVAPGTAFGEVELPRGLSATVYVTGERFDMSADRKAPGIPSTSTIAFDDGGALYLARVGRRYLAGEAEDLHPVYRIPVGGARLSPETEARYFYGPPLFNPQIGTTRDRRELFLTTFDRERRVGVLYRVVDGRAELFAGGTPERGSPPLLKQPEGVAVDGSGNVYVADRDRGAIVKLDARGRVLDPHYVAVKRPRALAVDARGTLWIGSDGEAEAPWQQGPGEIWQVTPEGVPRVVLRGPVAQAIALSAGGHALVADRHAAQIFDLAPDGSRTELLRFTGEDAPRSLAFAPITPDTRRAGIAGDLFVVVIRRGAWPVNEVLRIAGPLDDLIRERRPRAQSESPR
jgi:hypothetical protein